MRLVQYLDDEGLCAVAADVGEGHRRVADAGSTYALAWDAINPTNAAPTLPQPRTPMRTVVRRSLAPRFAIAGANTRRSIATIPLE